MSVFEIGKTISEATGGAAAAGGNSGLGNRFFFTDDDYCVLGLQRGTAYNVRIRLQGVTSAFVKLTMIGHRGYAPNALGNIPFCYIVEALPQNMGARENFNQTVTDVATRSFEDGIEAEHIMGGNLQVGDFYPTVSCFRYTDYTEITLRVFNKSQTEDSKTNTVNTVDTTSSDHSSNRTSFYAGQERFIEGTSSATATNQVEGQVGEKGADAIFFTAYIEGYSYDSPVSRRIGYGDVEGIATSYNKHYGSKGILVGGYGGGSTQTDQIRYFRIGILGNATDWGEFAYTSDYGAPCSDGNRCIVAGAQNAAPPVASPTDIYYFSTTSSSGDALDFGELTYGPGGGGAGGFSDGSRGISWSGASDTINHYTIGIQGNALDFGEDSRGSPASAVGDQCSDGNRAISGGAYIPPAPMDGIHYLTIGTMSSSLDFGELSQNRAGVGGVHDTSRAVFCCGASPTYRDTLDYVSMGTTGSAADFGESAETGSAGAAVSDGSRGVIAHGYDGSVFEDQLNYLTVATQGNAVAFGDDLSGGNYHPAGLSAD